MLVIILVSIVAIAIFLLSALESSFVTTGFKVGTFEKKWPAITEDEFMRRCPPGTDRSIALRVRRIVSEQLGIPYDHVYPEQNFVNDLGCD